MAERRGIRAHDQKPPRVHTRPQSADLLRASSAYLHFSLAWDDLLPKGPVLEGPGLSSNQGSEEEVQVEENEFYHESAQAKA